MTGFAIAIKLYQKIYKNGYYWTVTEDELLLTSKRINVDINLINDVINKMIVRNFFNSEIYKKHSILTSIGIQERYLEATKRRDNVDIHKELLLTETPVNVTLTSLNVDSNPQSKVKEIKEEKIIENTYPTFDDVWDLYGKKDKKKESKSAWCRLSQKNKLKVREVLPKYLNQFKSGKKDKKYQALLSSCLNGERWNDEYEDEKPQTEIYNF